MQSKSERLEQPLAPLHETKLQRRYEFEVNLASPVVRAQTSTDEKKKT